MDSIKATFTVQMERQWFLGFLKMLIECNPNRQIEITNTCLVVKNNKYYITGPISGFLVQVSMTDWILELDSHMTGVAAIVKD